MAKSKRFIEDLSKYEQCDDVERFGMAPLAIGFLQRGQKFAVGETDPEFLEKLWPYCELLNRVAALPQAMDCPLCGVAVTAQLGVHTVQLGSAEIRVIGEQAIFAAPDMLPHYVAVHSYQPPAQFIEAVLNGEGVDSAEFRALHNALR